MKYLRSFKRIHPSTAITVALVAACLLMPALGFAQDLDAAIKAKTQATYAVVYDFVYGVLGIALLVVFLMAAFGRMEWSRFAQVGGAILGCSLVAAIIQFFQT